MCRQSLLFLEQHPSIIFEFFYAFENVISRSMRASLSRRLLVFSRVPSFGQLLDGGHVDDAIMQMTHELGHVFVQEGLVRMHGIAG